MLRITSIEGGIRVEIKVLPRSSRNSLAGEIDGKLKVRITAPPVEGEANKMLIIFLSELLGLPRKNIRIIRGDTSTQKLVELMGISQTDFIDKLDI